MPRLFFAVWPPDDVVEELRSLPRKDHRGVRFLATGTWHVTLRFLGEAQIADAVDALAGVRFAPATARLGPAVDVLAGRALVIPVSGLDDVAGIVDARTGHLGRRVPRRRFLGHLTVARVKPDAPMPPALGLRVSATFTVDEVALVLSRLGPQGARYETVDTWPVG